MRRSNASPVGFLDDSFSSSHTLLSLRATSPAVVTSATPPPSPLVSDDHASVPCAHDKAVHISSVPADELTVVHPESATTSAPLSDASTTDPSVWTLAEIIDTGCSQHWSEDDYKLNRPSGFTGLKSWAQLDSGIRRRRHNHKSETWEVSFARVCRNLQRSQDQVIAEGSGDDESESCGDIDTTTRAAASSLIHHEIKRMRGEHKVLMNRFKEECRVLVLKITGELELGT
jgi:hypothetical protein